jgi:hypothetical protein
MKGKDTPSSRSLPVLSSLYIKIKKVHISENILQVPTLHVIGDVV